METLGIIARAIAPPAPVVGETLPPGMQSGFEQRVAMLRKLDLFATGFGVPHTVTHRFDPSACKRLKLGIYVKAIIVPFDFGWLYPQRGRLTR